MPVNVEESQEPYVNHTCYRNANDIHKLYNGIDLENAKTL